MPAVPASRPKAHSNLSPRPHPSSPSESVLTRSNLDRSTYRAGSYSTSLPCLVLHFQVSYYRRMKTRLCCSTWDVWYSTCMQKRPVHTGSAAVVLSSCHALRHGLSVVITYMYIQIQDTAPPLELIYCGLQPTSGINHLVIDLVRLHKDSRHRAPRLHAQAVRVGRDIYLVTSKCLILHHSHPPIRLAAVISDQLKRCHGRNDS